MKIALENYIDLIESGRIIYHESGETGKLHLDIIDGSYIEVYLSEFGKYSYLWDQREVSEKIYRHDNSPHKKWKFISTYPKHFHSEREDNVFESFISDEPNIAITEILDFVKSKLGS